MKFRKSILRRRFVKSDGGGVLGGPFSVQFVGLFKLRYREEDRSILAQIEPLKGDVNWMIYLDTVVRWEAPFEGVVLTQTQLLQVRGNIISALNAMGARYVASVIPGTTPRS